MMIGPPSAKTLALGWITVLGPNESKKKKK